MATGGPENNFESDLSAVSGSEAVFDHVCRPCSDDENIREAVGYCVDCEDWLCDECFRTHTRPKPCKHHVLRDREEMKKSTPHPKPTDKCTERCDQHKGKRLKYYCSVHEFFGCSLCVIQGHGTCKVDHIPDVCNSTDFKSELKAFTAKLEAIAKESVNNRNDLNKKEELVNSNSIETVNEFQDYIEKIKGSLDNIGAVLGETCKKHAEEETTKLKNAVRICDDIEKESLSMKTRLENLQNTGQHCNAFVALKRNTVNLESMERRQKDVSLSSSVTTCTFKPNIAVETIITGPEGIGKILENHSEKDRNYSKAQAQYITDISVRSKGNSSCSIAGLTLLSHEKLVLGDYLNCQVKVVHTKTKEMLSDYKVDGAPWDMCKASDNSVAVIDRNDNKLLFLSVDTKGNLSLLKTVPLKGCCRGVAIMDSKIVVGYINPAKLEVMDTSGTVLHTITDNKIVHSPFFITANPARKSVYISNRDDNTLTCVNIDGTILATYKDSLFQTPEQATIDSNDMIFATGFSSNNVHLLTHDCKKIKVLLDESNGLKQVRSVSFCEQTDRLYIGMHNCDVIKVFQLSG